MVRFSIRITTCALTAAIAFSQAGLTVQAAGASSVLPKSGVNIMLTQGTTLEALHDASGTGNVKIETIFDKETFERALKAAEAEKTAAEEEALKKLVIARVNNYVNVRSILCDRFYDMLRIICYRCLCLYRYRHRRVGKM